MVGEAAGDVSRPCLPIELVPDCPLTPRQALAFFASLCIVSFAIAGFFVVQGLWPVLPFAAAARAG